MYEVTQDYLDKATAAGRVYSLRVDVGEIVDGLYVDKAQYFGGVGVLSLKIVRGQTTGGFSLGGTVCAQLSATFTNDVDVRVKDRLQIYVRFGSGSEATAWKSLGWFYVDAVKQGLYNKSVTAYDAMLRFEKNYKSKLTYPASTSSVLNEISEQMKIGLSSDISLINDATIETVPQMDKSKDGEQRYYTRRAMLGYIAATNAGEAYIDVDFKINLAVPTETGYTIEAASVISQTIDDTDFMVDGVVWNKSGISYSLNDDFTENTVELTNPLEYTSEEQILHSLETKLVGLSYNSITLKKQGTGIFQLGDLVDYDALDGTVYTMLVMGIVYDFSNGFFSETLYSLAKSASQQEYAGNQITDTKEYTSSDTANIFALADYEYLTDTSVKYNGVTYTVEKDGTTGLISRISDDAGNEFDPIVNSGVNDVVMHNAAFLAVAMLSGLGGSTIMPVTAGLVGYFDYKRQCAPALWTNRLGGENIPITGSAAVNAECLQMPSSAYGLYDLPYTDGQMSLYVICKVSQDDGSFYQIVSNAGGDWNSPGSLREITSRNKLLYFTGNFTAYSTDLYKDGSTVSAEEYHIITLTQDAARNLKIYLDGAVVWEKTFPAVAFGNRWGLNCRTTDTTVYTTGHMSHFKMFAIGRTAHTAEQIATNVAWLKKYYGL